MMKDTTLEQEYNDHYIPQVYLRCFATDQKSKKRSKEVWVYEKPNIIDGNLSPINFRPVKIKEICQIKGWDNFNDSRKRSALNKFLNKIENGYNNALKNFRNGQFSDKDKQYIACNVARMSLWTPKEVKLFASWLSIKQKVREGVLHSNEESAFLASHFLNFYENSDKINDNLRFAKEHLLPHILDDGYSYFMMSWTVLINQTDTAFLTSDNPVCGIHSLQDNVDFYVPLAPDLGIKIYHPANLETLSVQMEIISTLEHVNKLNKIVIEQADKYVIANKQEDKIKIMVAQYFLKSLHNMGYPLVKICELVKQTSTTTDHTVWHTAFRS